MSAITPLMEGIYHIDTRIADIDTPFVSYLISGNPAVLIEPGPTKAIPGLFQAINDTGQNTGDIALIIPTHIHMDNSGGAGELARLWPQAQVVIHEQSARHLIDPTKLIAGTKGVFGDNFDEIYGPILAVPESQVLAVEDGGKLPLSGRSLTVLHTPGHAPHHICTYDETTNGVFCGEAVGFPMGDSNLFVPTAIPPNFDLEAALNAFDRVEGFDPAILFYSHAGYRQDVANSLHTARKTTRKVGDLVLSGLKEGEDFPKLLARVSQALFRDGFPEDKCDFSAMVAAYMLYFQKLGQNRQ